MRRSFALLFCASLLCAQDGPWSSSSFQGLRLRAIGPAVASGRITSIAVDPRDRARYFLGVASGGVWKTTNNGTSWTPVFDNEGSYSIGTVTLDPRNPDTVWVGTGENNSQRSVSYGDGVYKSIDGGKTWKNSGLKSSEHIGRILVDPRDSRVVYVAAQGPLWGPGGDRGLYKTTDGGATWKPILTVSENTGVTDIVMDPRNPDVLLAASYQRRRHIWTLINGGPETALYKSTDAGATWRKVTAGLPTGEMGRIGLAWSAAQPGLVYARIEGPKLGLATEKGGIFRSLDSGENWERRNDFDDLGMYYGQILADPSIAGRIYIMNTLTRASDDGGKTLRIVADRAKHVDTHTFWIDPQNSNYILSGCDGGLYESHDAGQTWLFKANLPVTQFYDVAVDNRKPHYTICGGTQDNATLCGPSRTRTTHGITNGDWFVPVFGDGFQARIDPKDPDTIYAEYQYGGLVRYDRRTGEKIGIKPVEAPGEPPLRWNWDSPVIISPHLNTRLYFAANRIFRSDDRGNRWQAFSPDLTRQLDRDALPVMGKAWGPDAVARHNSTSFYGNITALAESPKKDGLLFAGTDDGLLQIRQDNGQWRKVESFTGVPDKTYVARIVPSQHDASVVYAAFDNHKNADFKPYLLKSTDGGLTWSSIAGDLPANGPVLAIAEDHVNPKLLFAGTEFGLFFTVQGGNKWIRLKSGLPTIAVRDLAIQTEMNDLVVATFGRGFYVLDDYSPLRTLALDAEASLFEPRAAEFFLEATPLGVRGKGFQGEAFYTAENPPLAILTYYLKDTFKTKKQQRRDAEKEADKNKKPLPPAPRAALSDEEREEAPTVILTIGDAKGNIVRRLNGPATKGIQRVGWDLRGPAPLLAPPRPADIEDEFSPPPSGAPVPSGTYTIRLAVRVDGVTRELGAPRTIVVKGDNPELTEFRRRLEDLQRAVAATSENANSAKQKLAAIKRALDQSTAPASLRDRAHTLDRRLDDILLALSGDRTLQQRQENQPPSIGERVGQINGELRTTTAPPTATHRASFEHASAALARELPKLKALLESDLRKLEADLDAARVPPTPGRLPDWKK